MMEVKIKKHPHLPISLLPYHAQRPDLLEAGAGDVPYYYFTMPRGQTCWRLGLADVPYYYFTMPRNAVDREIVYIAPGAPISPQNLKP